MVRSGVEGNRMEKLRNSTMLGNPHIFQFRGGWLSSSVRYDKNHFALRSFGLSAGTAAKANQGRMALAAAILFLVGFEKSRQDA